MYYKCNIRDLINKNKEVISELLKFDNKLVLYKFHNIVNGKYYVGITKSSITRRLYSSKFGHIFKIINNKDLGRLHKAIINEGYDNFEFIIDSIYNTINDLDNAERSEIRRLDSFNNGYNGNLGGLGSDGLIIINNGIINKRIKPDEDIPEGFSIGEIRNDLKNRTIINDGEKFLRVKNEDLQDYLNNGFKLGSGGLTDYSTGIIFMNNGVDMIRIPIEDSLFYENKGYKRGRLNGTKLKGKIRIANGVENKSIYPDELEKYESNGYSKGVLKSNNRKGSSGRKYLNKNGTIISVSNDEELNEKLLDGYSLGRGKGPLSDKVKVNNGIETFIIDINLLEDYLSNGYSKGSLKTSKNKGKRSMTNGITNILVSSNEIDHYTNLGYHLGITRKSKKRRNN